MKQVEKHDYDTFVKELEQIDIPHEQLEESRIKSVMHFRKEKRNRQRTWKGIAVTCALLLIFVMSIRISPALASAIAKIPGFAPLVQMITDDKGVKDILHNNYYEELGLSQTKNGLSFTLQGVIADETGMILPYTFSAPFDVRDLEIKEIELRLNGEVLPAGISYSWYRAKETSLIEENLEAIFKDPINYDNAEFELYLQFADEKQTEFTMPFSLKKSIAKTKTYQLNEKLSFEGQHITVKSVSISPLRTGITIALDPHNDMRILGFDDIRLLDEKGEEWTTISNGLVSTGTLMDGEETLFMQSNYFREPKKLTLSIGKVKALPKGQDFIDVDFKQMKVLSKPPLPGLEVQVNKQMVTINVPTSYKNKNISLLGTAIDANGETVYSNSGSHYRPDEYVIEQTETYDLIGVVNPVRIYFSHYENLLEGTQTVEIPLK
ncbi:DUF4179 domain-containing protein [Lysinibacillus agricola]|uniref:DUF4179 domain-containing protein n=1 Tax=Lysinibacillus agricola TaxID=2590012 RepID=A0ABX7ANS1_9BACI|nr:MULTISPECIES: DUF4179 domain-containing protein [Lysinibacillus]KOS61382.1 hypothetical protein AN161_17435 [Lysinibacillus sp. FJAT-14222]QQP10937.1 DUF4179 domain-containing protein [Lysinibacillus agricola]